MKLTEFRKLIREEINKVLNKPIYDPKNTRVYFVNQSVTCLVYPDGGAAGPTGGAGAATIIGGLLVVTNIINNNNINTITIPAIKLYINAIITPIIINKKNINIYNGIILPANDIVALYKTLEAFPIFI